MLRKKQLFLTCLFVLTILSLSFFAYFSFKYSNKTKAAAVSCVGSSPATCTISGGGRYNLSEGQYENSNLIINGITVYGYGQHNIASLIIKNGGILTHDSLVWPDDFVQAPGVPTSNTELNAQGKRKVVNFHISGKLRLESAGKVDVSGKGYPGSSGEEIFADCHENCGSGKGSGGGGNADRHDEPTFGGGGGYGGLGGAGVGNLSGYAGATYGGLSSDPATLWHGSGGGGAWRHQSGALKKRPGKAGGGAIYLVVNDIETDGNVLNTIIANGNPPVSETCRVYEACGGAGSGGSIYVKMTNYSGNSRFNFNVEGGLSDETDRSGHLGAASVRGFSNDSGHEIQVYANGGAGGPIHSWDHPETGYWIYPGSGGGGGRILIEAKIDNTMKKWLTPVSRAESGDFNPYSLRFADKIQVHILVERLEAGTVIEDEILKKANLLSGMTKCIPSEPYRTNISDGGTFSGDKVIWVYGGSNKSHEFNYFCQVQ